MDLKNYHTKLFPYAYNILGTSADAKDVVQDVLVTFLSLDKTQIENEIGYLIKSVINRSINLKKRKNKILPGYLWLPEPFATENTDDDISSKEILSYSLLVLLEKLTPKERAVFILKEAFDYSHKEIATTIDFTIDNSRKTLSRARVKLSNFKKIGNPNIAQDIPYLENYMNIIKKGDVASLEKLLSKDILMAADGGSNIKVVRELTHGTTAASKLLLYVYEAYLKQLTFKIGSVNHQPALLYYHDETLYNCQVFELSEEKVINIFSIVDPEKLKSLFN